MIEAISATKDQQATTTVARNARRSVTKARWWPVARRLQTAPRQFFQVQEVRLAVHTSRMSLASGLDPTEDAEMSGALHRVGSMSQSLPWWSSRDLGRAPDTPLHVEDHDK